MFRTCSPSSAQSKTVSEVVNSISRQIQPTVRLNATQVFFLVIVMFVLLLIALAASLRMSVLLLRIFLVASVFVTVRVFVIFMIAVKAVRVMVLIRGGI